MTQSTIRRRTLVRGAAWSLPAIAASTAVPAYAASCGICANEKALPDYRTQKNTATLPHIDFGAAWNQRDGAWTFNRDQLYANTPIRGYVPQWGDSEAYGIFWDGGRGMDMVFWASDWAKSKTDNVTEQPEQFASVKIPMRNLNACCTYTVRIMTDGRAGWDRGIDTMPTKLDVAFYVGGHALNLSGANTTPTTVGFQTYSEQYSMPYPTPEQNGRIRTKLGGNGDAVYTKNPDVSVTFTVPNVPSTSDAYMLATFILPKPSEWPNPSNTRTQRNNDDYHISAVLTSQCCSGS